MAKYVISEGNLILDGDSYVHVGVSGSTKSIEIKGSSTQGYIAKEKHLLHQPRSGILLVNNNTDLSFMLVMLLTS